MGTHFKTSWDSKGTAIPLALTSPIGARAPCWLRIPKGTAVSPAGSVGASKCLRHFEVATGDPHPLAVVSKGGGAALAGGTQRRAEPSWREESNETGGFVAHDFARKV